MFGIQNFSPSIRVEKDVEVLKEAVQTVMSEIYTGTETFKITAKRSDHQFIQDSNQLNLTLGNAVIDRFPEIKVQMKKARYQSTGRDPYGWSLPFLRDDPRSWWVTGWNEWERDADAFRRDRFPVAGYFAMKRGVEIEAVHFASPPYTSEQALQKSKDLTKKLTPYVGGIQFIEVPFTEVQEEIKKHVPQGYWMTITRRMMLRLTDAIREARHGLIILNGESLGQVASQTLQKYGGDQ